MYPPDTIIIIVFGEGGRRFSFSDFMSETNGMEKHVESALAPDVTHLLGGSEDNRAARRITFSIDRILGREACEKNAGSAPKDTPSDKQSPEPPIWIYCSRFSARPTAGPRRRSNTSACEDRRCRTAFTGQQVSSLRSEFQLNEYLSETRRRQLAQELGLTEAQIKIWFQNARAKRRRSCGRQSPLAKKLAEAGLYNHSSSASSAS